MVDRHYDLHDTRVAVLMDDGAPLRNDSDAAGLISEAAEYRAHVIAISAKRFDAGFFRLRTGIAGQVIQKFLTYGFRLVIVGDISEHLQESSALRDFVYECNRGSHVWFVADLDELHHRLLQTKTV